MIKATIQNSPYCTEICFYCSEAELSKKLGEIGMNPEHLAPMATVIEIEPAELSMFEDCDVSLDALNFLGKRMDGMDKEERDQFLAVLSSSETGIGSSLKNVINLTYNLARFTLIEDTDDLESVGRTHMLNVRGYLSESEYNNGEWLAEQGVKLLESGSGIDTDYGKLYINKEIPFDEVFNGTTFPAYYCEMNSVAEIAIEYDKLTEFVEMPCDDMLIQKALCRLGADDILDCKIEVDSSRDISNEWWEKICEVEKTKDIFGLNELLKTEDVCIKRELPKSVFYREMSKWLKKNEFDFFEKDGCMIVSVDDGAEAKIYNNGTIAALTENVGDEYHDILQAARNVYEYCSVYEKAAPLKAENLSENYRCLSEFNGTVLAAKHTEYGFEFVTWDRTYDGKAVCHGNYFEDYAAAKENFAARSGLIDKDKMFSTEELERLGKSVEFTMQNCGELNFDDCERLKNLNAKISEDLPEQQQSAAPEMSM